MQLLIYLILRISIAITLSIVIGYGWLLNVKHLLAVDNLSILDYPWLLRVVV